MIPHMGRAIAHIHEHPLSSQRRTVTESQKQGLLQWLFGKWFTFPSGEFAIVMENGSKLSLPYPLLAALLALFVWIAGGTLAGVWALASMSTNVANLTATMTREQAIADTERKALQEKLELQALLISDLREKIIRLEERRRLGN